MGIWDRFKRNKEKKKREQVEELLSEGRTLRDKGKFREALECFRKVTELEPENARIYSARADICINHGKSDEAYELALKAYGLALEDAVGDKWRYTDNVWYSWDF